MNWNNAINHELSSRARNYFTGLETLQEICVPKCLQEAEPEIPISMQTFVDASSETYGSVSYLRSECARGHIWSKTRPFPLAPMSTPRLELMAAFCVSI